MSARQAICNALYEMCIQHNMAVNAIEYDTNKNNCFIRVDNREKWINDCPSDDTEFKKEIAQAIKSMQKQKG